MGIGTITTYEFCAVKDGQAFTGTRAEILARVCDFWIDEKRQLHAHFKGFEPADFHSYSIEYTAAEAYDDAVKSLFERLPEYGYRIFRDIGF